MYERQALAVPVVIVRTAVPVIVVIGRAVPVGIGRRDTVGGPWR